jgi:DNA end-binding protein Ku
MPRSIWNGVVSFGMVSIPVKLYTATETKDIAFRQLHQECGSRLKQQRWCPVCEREVEWGEVVRGYEHVKDQHIILSDDDFAKLPLPSKHTIDLAAFVKAEEIDPIFYERSYYLEPEETGTKPFVLLMRALNEKGLTAVAKVALRNKEQLCALRPYNGTLMLETLYYPDEIRVQQEKELPEVKVSAKELQMAFSLIDLMSDKFEPEQYHDEYRQALASMIEAKLQGAELVEAPAPARGKVVDLMSALKASVEAAKGKQRPAAGKQPVAMKRPAARRRKTAAG